MQRVCLWAVDICVWCMANGITNWCYYYYISTTTKRHSERFCCIITNKYVEIDAILMNIVNFDISTNLIHICNVLTLPTF